MTALATYTDAPRSRVGISGNRPEMNDGRMEFTFKDIHELCAFVAREINFSKVKYSKIAEKADVCHGTVSRMAQGITQHPRAETVFSMLKVLGYEVVVRS